MGTNSIAQKGIDEYISKKYVAAPEVPLKLNERTIMVKSADPLTGTPDTQKRCTGVPLPDRNSNIALKIRG
ncbi:hypothetical protein ASG89_15465 [Paenibacillus sp. Soil766]|uniref:hypothetical protein n=1 Tax=Paenibacillus sp. Soil766 TaxID=1736404 RepID=UPI00070B47C8|nr:hypothetical protein [Paenibacillus sp. Soil766]KRF09614.1 hypothetical protein ASG89_15465 [Paenibacillus sp. Soil766]